MPRRIIQIGDIVSPKQRIEALYSGYYQGTPSEYPVQWFEPDMKGFVVGVCDPFHWNGRTEYDYMVQFEGAHYGCNKESFHWTARVERSEFKIVMPVERCPDEQLISNMAAANLGKPHLPYAKYNVATKLRVYRETPDVIAELQRRFNAGVFDGEKEKANA